MQELRCRTHGFRFFGGDATKHFSMEKMGFSMKRGEGFRKDFYREGNSVKMSGRFGEPPDSENCKVSVLIPFLKISS